ncbi:MAG: RNA-binding transcriptional accessory protein [candidate division KSB1 bacterium]|nr:RNA-binding transcriptional accessory protein [candidate division KSB1 bacterium]MDZ7393242.1 RNA-binding transcriptional accessory protein [candidate division KSB1 bacterium]MDZ7412462.1 RNA-binding transcriptional accessory protein [candidate division KSB1 bacterium]
MNDDALVALIAEEMHLSWRQVRNTVELLDAGNTVPFIARYRKELTGSLDEEYIRAIEGRMRYLRNLEQRKEVVLRSIQEQGKLTPELEARIRASTKLQEVEDLYLPYRPKRRTRATVAREQGLEPLAQMILAQEVITGDRLEAAAPFICPEKGVNSAEEALQGARDIVAEIISDDADVRQLLREATWKRALLHSTAKDPAHAGVYQMYADRAEPVRTIPPHRTLAINRGEREGVLRVEIEIETEPLLHAIKQRYMANPQSIFTQDLEAAIADAYERLLAPAIARDIRAQLTDRAEDKAIRTFAENLRHLLMTPPVRGKVIMGIDPGYRTGCKVAVIDPTGKYLESQTIYPHEPQRLWDEAKQVLQELIEDHKVDIVAIGNGTASRETETLVSEVIADSPHPVVYTIVNEAGASVYSASPLARQELPELDASMRGTVSIARRLLDPLAELVKIDPKSIGVGMYQHDVDQGRLGEALDWVVQSCVNRVGVELNTASPALLRFVAGINRKVAEAIVAHRNVHGPFKSREDLKKVKGLGENTFVQAAGFLRISDGDHFFDATAVHPESYPAAERLLSALGLSIQEVKQNGALIRTRMREMGLTIEQLAPTCGCGSETLADIVASLERPGRDPRDEVPGPIFRRDVLKIEDLKPGMVLKGTVRNVVDFGAFVDIGVKQDGLVHRSQMARTFVKDPMEVVSVGDVVEVKVLSVDSERGRIALSLILDEPSPPPESPRPAPSDSA